MLDSTAQLRKINTRVLTDLAVALRKMDVCLLICIIGHESKAFLLQGTLDQ